MASPTSHVVMPAMTPAAMASLRSRGRGGEAGGVAESASDGITSRLRMDCVGGCQSGIGRTPSGVVTPSLAGRLGPIMATAPADYNLAEFKATEVSRGPADSGPRSMPGTHRTRIDRSGGSV